MLELMARGGIWGGEVLNLVPANVLERTLVVQNPKSGAQRKGFMFYENY